MTLAARTLLSGGRVLTGGVGCSGKDDVCPDAQLPVDVSGRDWR
jgi:hypothetical protein